MFIGEMGCWIIVGMYTLIQRFKAHKSKANAPVLEPSEHDALLTHSDEETAYEDEDPLASSMVLPHDDREHMTGYKTLWLALPACCDIAGTTLMNVGLLFVAASIYQMTRGALVLFVGLFSVIFLKRRLHGYKWFSLFVVVAGVAVVGLAGAIAKHEKQNIPSVLYGWVKGGKDEPIVEPDVAVKTVVGVLLIAAAQIFTATQFVLEESIMERYSIEPLKAVGWEGLWGFLVTVFGMVVLHFTYGVTEAGKYGYFDAREGLKEVFQNPAIAISSLLIMISIG
jgi:drug/metabolite transporter (DMT)-like permease